MSTIRVNEFQIDVSDYGGHPVWIRLSRPTGGPTANLGSFDHKQLHDLKYAVDRAIVMARQALAKMPEPFKSEMD